MAISTGDIYADAITDLQARVEAGLGDLEIELNLQQLCFIFNKKCEFGDADLRTDFEDMAAWLEAQSWSTGITRFVTCSYAQTVMWSQPPLPPST